MQLTEFADAPSFLRTPKTLDFLMRHEAENNLLLGSLLTLARASVGRIPGMSFFILRTAEGEVAGAALNISDRRLVVSHLESEVAFTFGKHLGQCEAPIRSLLGPAATMSAFKQGLGRAEFQHSNVRQELLQLRLDKNDFTSPERASENSSSATASGLWRLARAKDTRLIYRWTRAFCDESDHDETPEESHDLVQKYVANRQLYLWEDGMSPVAMAGFSGLTPNGVRINMVYTEPTARRRGYAASLVTALNRRLLAPGEKKFCLLFVDARNLAAISVYRKLGYKMSGSFLDYGDEIGSSVSTTGK